MKVEQDVDERRARVSVSLKRFVFVFTFLGVCVLYCSIIIETDSEYRHLLYRNAKILILCKDKLGSGTSEILKNKNITITFSFQQVIESK